MSKFRILENKMDICLAIIGFNVGSINEPKHLAGISHLLEHMLFHDAKKSYLIDLLSSGFTFNAVTGKDITYYYIQGPAAAYKTIIESLLRIVSSLNTTMAKLENEKRVVIEEMYIPRRGLPVQIIIPLLNDSNPYKNSVIGSEETINAITVEDLKEFHDRYYVSPSCVMTIDKKYASKAGTAFKKAVGDHFRQDERKAAIINMNANLYTTQACTEPYHIFALEHARRQSIIMGFATVPYNDLRKIILELFAFILSNRMMEQFREEMGAIYGIVCRNFFYKYMGVFGVDFSSAKSNLTKLIPQVYQLINDTKTKLKKTEFEFFKSAFLKSAIESVKSPESNARFHLHDLLYDHHISYTPEVLRKFISTMDVTAFRLHLADLIQFHKSTVILYTTENEKKVEAVLKKSIDHYAA